MKIINKTQIIIIILFNYLIIISRIKKISKDYLLVSIKIYRKIKKINLTLISKLNIINIRIRIIKILRN